MEEQKQLDQDRKRSGVVFNKAWFCPDRHSLSRSVARQSGSEHSSFRTRPVVHVGTVAEEEH